MKQQLYYVELKTGYNDDGPAWVGTAFFSKSGHAIYFNGLILKGSGKGNCHEIETAEMYWTSGIKKNGEDRHWAGSGKIFIDKNVVTEYLDITNRKELPSGKYIVVELNNEPQIEKATILENKKLTEPK